MIREVDFVDYYLPPYMQNYKEPVATLKAEQPEFTIVWKAVDRILYNRFIATADEYGISRFEKILGIFPESEDTLESRRARVQSKWFAKTPYTYRVLLEKLQVSCKDTNFTVICDFSKDYVLNVTTAFEMYGQVEELCNSLTQMLPTNIVINVKNEIDIKLDTVQGCTGVVVISDNITIGGN